MKNYTEIFRGTSALVTGGGKRLGRAIALELAVWGVKVAVHYNNSREDALETVDKIRSNGGEAFAIDADLANPDEVEGLTFRVAESLGHINFLINNASIYPKSKFYNITAADIDEAMHINTYAPLQLIRAFAEQKQRGAIINMLDTRIHSYDDKHLAYHLSKQALQSLTKIAAYELAPYIRVNGVSPGIILPPEGEGKAWLDKMRHTNILGSYGSVEDITDAVLFLLASDFVTGEVIHIDGGRHLKHKFYG